MYSLEDLKRKKNNLEFMTKSKEGKTELSISSGTTNGLAPITKDLRKSLGLNKSDKTVSISQKIDQMSESVLEDAATILKESRTHLICFFDKSASCIGTEPATIAGYKSLIDNERRTGLPTKVTTILFDERSYIINNHVPVEAIPDLYYNADGNGTAIYDCLTTNLERIKSESTGEKTIVAIMTDGEDNRSQIYNMDFTRQIIKECINLGWEFIFLGANYRAIEVGKMIGIREENLALFTPTSDGYYTNFKAVQKALDSFRKEGKVSPDWSKIIKQVNLAIANGETRENILALDDGKDQRLGGR